MNRKMPKDMTIPPMKKNKVLGAMWFMRNIDKVKSVRKFIKKNSISNFFPGKAKGIESSGRTSESHTYEGLRDSGVEIQSSFKPNTTIR
jgi:hypothetical protein